MGSYLARWVSSASRGTRVVLMYILLLRSAPKRKGLRQTRRVSDVSQRQISCDGRPARSSYKRDGLSIQLGVSKLQAAQSFRKLPIHQVVNDSG